MIHPQASKASLVALLTLRTPACLSRQLPPEAPKLPVCRAQENSSPTLHVTFHLSSKEAPPARIPKAWTASSLLLTSLRIEIANSPLNQRGVGRAHQHCFPLPFLRPTSSSSHFKMKQQWQGILRNVKSSSAAVSNGEGGRCGTLYTIQPLTSI